MTLAESLLTDLEHDTDLVLTATGDLSTLSGLDNVKAAILRRIITTPGEIVHRPNYGVGIEDFQNAPSTRATHRQLALRIEEQLKEDPRVEAVEEVAVQEEADHPEMLKIAVRVKVKGYGDVSLTFHPFGEVAL